MKFILFENLNINNRSYDDLDNKYNQDVTNRYGSVKEMAVYTKRKGVLVLGSIIILTLLYRAVSAQELKQYEQIEELKKYDTFLKKINLDHITIEKFREIVTNINHVFDLSKLNEKEKQLFNKLQLLVQNRVQNSSVIDKLFIRIYNILEVSQGNINMIKTSLTALSNNNEFQPYSAGLKKISEEITSYNIKLSDNYDVSILAKIMQELYH